MLMVLVQAVPTRSHCGAYFFPFFWAAKQILKCFEISLKKEKLL
jgi:hypothetical protein